MAFKEFELGSIPLTHEDRERSVEGLKVLRQDARDADEAYHLHVIECGLCEVRAKPHQVLPAKLLEMLDPAQKNLELVVHCPKGIDLWQKSVERITRAKNAERALKVIGVPI